MPLCDTANTTYVQLVKNAVQKERAVGRQTLLHSRLAGTNYYAKLQQDVTHIETSDSGEGRGEMHVKVRCSSDASSSSATLSNPNHHQYWQYVAIQN
jgi:hypothetical protein